MTDPKPLTPEQIAELEALLDLTAPIQDAFAKLLSERCALASALAQQSEELAQAVRERDEWRERFKQEASDRAATEPVYRAAVRLGDAWQRAADGEIGGLSPAQHDLWRALGLDISTPDTALTPTATKR
ncbi:MAG TPA: hypothetical protein VFT98_00450 [Myxococcota bacterium]|nr:hypothetical protein [Myxococcota bacterium]